jgi:hypothetical protein
LASIAQKIAACLFYFFMLYWVVFFLMGVWLVSKGWVVVIRGLVFIFYCVDWLVFLCLEVALLEECAP